ncbi:FAD-binding domain-containing protein [Cryphonectria parasitica EP155]|uniref:FAD-binding domain-containing protein n=1 Tax=Cryphonectria parasitica (strain ATCC 38755 / EP155) TaxID=660469 RepID=A0A9P4YAR4_CRYP1|nr:FAD-binding domain-containing protein [Cryphonectria parasitica EP155]KAF3769586.1 FAD-binding domain-containing protein [Cryphonectria parasitica EP155]
MCPRCSIIILAALCCCFHQPSSAAAVPHVLRQVDHRFTPRAPTAGEIQLDLGPQLSNGSSIWFPGSEEFSTATSRWNIYGEPNISVVVEVATAEDVAATVQYANSIDMPFLAVNRGHGSPYTLSKLQNGIEIWLSQLNSIDIAEDGNSAVLGGGVYIEEVVHTLFEYGKVAVTGSCACVGNMGAGLGGGHGRLQGYFGLIVDNIISMDVVLWNGTQIIVNEDSYPDLFWGLRGAGHNFGIVTSFDYKIYDQPSSVWFYGLYYFNEDQLENIFNEMNRQSEATLPEEIGGVLLFYVWSATINATDPVLVLTFNYAGGATAAAPYIDPFKAFGPVASTEGQVPYDQISNVSGTGVASPLCAHGTQRMQFSCDLLTYNVTTNREMYELYRNMTLAEPSLVATSVVFESYSLQGIKAVPGNSTAYPHRGDNLIWSQVIAYDYDPGLDATAIAWGEQARQLIRDGQPPGEEFNVYVNYAFGGETLESVYGYETWRLEKLRALKKEWDPQGKFSYYMPIS